MKLRPHCLANLPTINGSWLCADCRQTPRPKTYVYRNEHFCETCVSNRLKVEFMDLLLDASPELTLDGLMVHVSALVVDERLRLQDDAECPALTGADRAELREAKNAALDDDGPDEKGALCVKVFALSVAEMAPGVSALEAWTDEHAPAPLSAFAKALVARVRMFEALLPVYLDKPLYKHFLGKAEKPQ